MDWRNHQAAGRNARGQPGKFLRISTACANRKNVLVDGNRSIRHRLVLRVDGRCLAQRHGFTLFELLLAVALAASLLVLVGAAINLYLQQCDTDRLRVEEAQIARVTLDMIARDLRSAVVYEPQSMSGLAQMIRDAASASEASSEGGGSSGGGGGGGGRGGNGSQGGSGGGGTSNSSSSSTESNAANSTTDQAPPGVYGDLENLIVDAYRRPPPATWSPTSEAMNGAAAPPPILSDIRSIRWYVRPGEQVRAAGLAATELDPEQQQRIGGLVRQEVDRATRMTAEGSGASPLIESPGRLIAPEIVRLQFRYFSGEEVFDLWDTSETSAVPKAVEVTIWLRPADAEGVLGPIASGNYSADPATLRQYSTTVYLPLARVPDESATQSGSTTGGSTSTGGF